MGWHFTIFLKEGIPLFFFFFHFHFLSLYLLKEKKKEQRTKCRKNFSASEPWKYSRFQVHWAKHFFPPKNFSIFPWKFWNKMENSLCCKRRLTSLDFKWKPCIATRTQDTNFDVAARRTSAVLLFTSKWGWCHGRRGGQEQGGEKPRHASREKFNINQDCF